MFSTGASPDALRSVGRARNFVYRLIASATLLLVPLVAQATLTVSPLTWNVIGLDSNSPTSGPKNFPVGARVCSDVATTNVTANFVFDSANANINLRAGSFSGLNFPAIAAGTCVDGYFEVSINQVAAAYDTARRYHITATDGSGTYSTPTPRELYVEHLISQARNSITDVKYGTSIPSLVSVAAGGSMNLVVGNTYVIQLLGGTATQGYNQFEAFINFPNTVFQILSVNTSYSADNSPFVANPNDKLYADACLWQNDPNDPNYRACVGGDFKAGGTNVVTTYTIKIIGGGGTSQSLNTLLYDFSGSSFHYNSDFSAAARIANIIDPTSAGISKSFSPSTVPVNGVSVLSITLTNANAGALSGYNFVDNLPPNMTVANPSGATTSGCGAPTLTATAGSSTISFSNGTVAANSSCVISVNVTPSATGSLVNTTNDLFVGSIDTTHSATATLTVNNAPPPPACTPGLELARWTMDPAQGLTAPPSPSFKSVLVSTATALYTGSGTSAIDTTQGNPVNSWSGTGWAASGSPSATVAPFMDFTLDTSKFTNVKVSAQAFIGSGNWAAPANNFLDIFTSANGGAFGAAILNWNLPKGSWNTIPGAPVAASSTGSATTTFRFNAVGAKTLTDPMYLDNIVFTGCGVPAFPTIAKAFAPNSIAVNATSTLTFTLANSNSVALTGATFTDSLPAGVQVAATPAASTTCGGTWTPASGNTTLNFSGGTIPTNGSCTLSVNVTATTAGPHNNVSGFLSTTETGQNPNSVASATLTALSPPQIAKEFAPNPILPGGTSTLTFTITNPNQNDALSGVAFGDTFPTSPGAMVVAAAPNATTNGCGVPTFSPSAGAGSITFSGGTIAPGGICLVSVNVTAPVAGTYNNTSGNVSHVINAQTVNGNSASASLTVNPPHPAIGLLKQVGSSASGPWTPFLDVNLPNNVYYQFTIENTGDVPLSPISLTDDTLDVSACNAALPSTLPVAVAANNNHIATCVVGPVAAASGAHTNTAHATGTFNAVPVNSLNSSATYATTGLTLVKSATESSFTLPGDTLHYSYLVTNNGFAPLLGPVTVSDNKTTVTCPAVSTVGDLDNYLDPGESITCTATYIVTGADVAAGSVTNTASATINGVSSNNASKTVPLSTSADVSIDKTLTTSAPYFAGQSISYTLTVANAGPSTATSIQVTDTPSNMTITNVSGSGCASLPCTIASLASGASTQIFVTAKINAAGAFDNSASVSAAQPDPNPGNNTDNTGNGGTAADAVDLAVVKTFVTPGPYRNADVITFNIAVTNNGPSTATNVVVVDHPVGLSVLTMSGGGCNGASVPGSHNQNVQCTIASMASGETQNVTVTANIDNPGQFTNDGIVSADQTDTNTANNDSQVVDVATTSADVSIVKNITTPGPYYVGESITYTLTIHNAGPSPAVNVQVNDTPSNMTITNVSGPTGNAFSCSSFPCQMVPAMVIGNTRVMTVTATINAAGAFSNTATANGTDFDPDTSNNTSAAGGTTSPSADVAVVKTFVTPGPYRNADVITFNIAVTNNGPDTATNIVVRDHPVGLSVLTMSGGGCTGASVPGGHNQNVQCTIASLANGATANVSVTANIDNPGQFTNDGVIVSADQIDPNSTNNDSQVVDVATTSADVSIVKNITTPGPYYVGESITYTLTMHNAGPSPAVNVFVNDTPSNMTITNVSGPTGNAFSCSSFPCQMVPAMVIGNTRVMTVTATINAAGAFSNTATANGQDFDPNTANNTSTAGGTAASAADVSLLKTLTTAGPYNAGQSITYSIVVANAGPSTATNVTVADTPTNVTITNVSGSGCSAMPCTIGSLASGANTTISVTGTINSAGAFSNSAAVAATEFDPNPANNTSTAGATTGPTADVSVVKTLTTAGPYSVGQSISYTIAVANAGASTATNIVVTDTPTNMTITNVSGSGCATMPCTIASLASGANTTINVTGTINAVGAFSNSATATATEFDPNTANNTSTMGGTASASADVSLVKTLTTAGPYTPGQSLSYTIVVANAGPSTATNIVVTDTPTNLTITNVSGSGCAAMPCTIASLASGANTTINVTATIKAAGAFDNSATATAAEFDPNTANNTDNTGNGGTTGASADVSLVKTLTTAGPYTVGQSLNYTIVVANAGPSTATNIVVTETPTNMTITNVSGAGCSAVPCTIASLASGANTTINVTAKITAAGAFDNSATATAVEFDPNTANNADNTGNGGTASASADVSLAKTLTTAGPYSVGQSLNYTIVVANAGPSTATNILVTETPTNMTLTNVSGSGCAAMPCTIASLASGASTTINVTATIAAAGAFDNSATATAVEADPNPANNTDSTGNGGVASVLNSTVPAPVDARWALWLLVLGLLAGAKAAERRRRQL